MARTRGIEGNDGIALRPITGIVREFWTGTGEDPANFGNLPGAEEVFISGLVPRTIIDHEEYWGEEGQLSLAANTGDEVPWTRWPYPTENDFSWSWDEMRGTESGQMLVDNGFDREGWADIMFIRQELQCAFENEEQIIASGSLRVEGIEAGVQWDVDEDSLQLCWNDDELRWHSLCIGFSEEGEFESFDLEIDEVLVEDEEKRRLVVTQLLSKMKLVGRSSLVYDVSAFTEEQLIAEETLEIEELGVDEMALDECMAQDIKIRWIGNIPNLTEGIVERGKELMPGGMRLNGIRGEGDGYRIGQDDGALLAAATAWKIGTDDVLRDTYMYLKYWKEAGGFEAELREWGIWGEEWKQIVGIRDTLVLETMERPGGLMAQVVYEMKSGEVEWQWDKEASTLRLSWEGIDEEYRLEFKFNVAGILTNFDVYVGYEVSEETKIERLAGGLDVCREAWREGYQPGVVVMTGEMISGDIPCDWIVEDSVASSAVKGEGVEKTIIDTVWGKAQRVYEELEEIGFKPQDWQNMEFIIKESIKTAEMLETEDYFEGELYVGGREFWLEWNGEDGEYELSWMGKDLNECGVVFIFGESGELEGVEYCGTVEEMESGDYGELLKALEAIGEIRCREYGINVNKNNEVGVGVQKDEPEMGWVDPEVVDGLNIYRYDQQVVFDKNGRIISLNLN